MPPLTVQFLPNRRASRPRIHHRWVRAAANGMRAECPVRTGRMKRSIRWSRLKRNVRVNVRYASYVQNRGRSAGWVNRGVRRSKMASRYPYEVKSG